MRGRGVGALPKRRARNPWIPVLASALATTMIGCSQQAETPLDQDPADDPSSPSPPDCEPTPAAEMAVTINEFMAANAVTIADNESRTPDWVELYNASDREVSLCGYGITDDFTEPHKDFLGEEAVIPAGGHLLIWLSGDEVGGRAHASFKLSGDGEEIGLADADGVFLSRVSFGAQAVDFSAAREPDGSDSWVIEWHASPGQPNPDGEGLPLGSHDPGGEPEVVPAAGDLSERILGYDVIPEIGIRVEPGDVAKLEAEPRVYVPGYLSFDGREYGPVGVRLKGGNSFRPIHDKPSFRINIDEFVESAKFFALDDLTLNNMVSDFSMVHERLAYLVARQSGPASRANHAVLTFNGEHYGLYTNVETVKWHLIARWFEDHSGPLFEATDVDFSAEYIDAFEHEDGPDDRSKLAALADALTDPDPDAAIAAASSHVHMDSFLDFWAMEAVIGQFDAFPYSIPGDDYFVYADPTTQKLWFFPWGMDETFYSGEHDISLVSSVLATTCNASTSCWQAFEQKVREKLDLIEDMDLVAELSSVSAQVAPHVADDGRKPYSDAEVAEFQMQLYWFLSGRRAELEGQFGDDAPQ